MTRLPGQRRTSGPRLRQSHSAVRRRVACPALVFFTFAAALCFGLASCSAPLGVRPLDRAKPATDPEGWGAPSSAPAPASRSAAPPPAISRNAGDANCDGRVDFLDIDPFAALLADAARWSAQTGCPREAAVCLGDCNGDGRVDFADINPFVALLALRGEP